MPDAGTEDGVVIQDEKDAGAAICTGTLCLRSRCDASVVTIRSIRPRAESSSSGAEDECAPHVVDWTAPAESDAGDVWQPPEQEIYSCPAGSVRVHVRDIWSNDVKPSLGTWPSAPLAVSIADVQNSYVQYWARRDGPDCNWYSVCIPGKPTSLQLKAISATDGCTQSSPSGTLDLSSLASGKTDVYIRYGGSAANLSRDYVTARLPTGPQAFDILTDRNQIAPADLCTGQADAGVTAIDAGQTDSRTFVKLHVRWPWGDPTQTGFAGTSCEFQKLGQNTPPYPTSIEIANFPGCNGAQAMLDFQDGNCPWYTALVPRSAWKSGAPSLMIRLPDWQSELTTGTIALPTTPSDDLWIAYSGPPDDTAGSAAACQNYSSKPSSYLVFSQNPGPGYGRCGSETPATIDPCKPAVPTGYQRIHFRYMWAGQKTYTLFPRPGSMPKWIGLEVNGVETNCTREADSPWFSCPVPNSQFGYNSQFRAIDRTHAEEWSMAQTHPFAAKPGEYWVKWEYGRPDSESGEFRFYDSYPDGSNGDWSAMGDWNDQSCVRASPPAEAEAPVGFGATVPGAFFPYDRTQYAYPFGASLAHVYTATDKVQRTLNAFVFDRYNKWKLKYVATNDKACGAGTNTARILTNSSDTTSEAQGSGMAIAAAIGDKDTFDKLWTFVRRNLTQSEKKYCGGLMAATFDGSTACRTIDVPCDPDATNCGGAMGSSFDGDVDVGMGLVFAARQWPEEYADEAAAWIEKMECEVNTTYDGKWSYPAPGDTVDKTCQDYPNARCHYQPAYAGIVNLSYYPPAYFRVFGDFLADRSSHSDGADDGRTHQAFWYQTAETVYEMYERCYDSRTVHPALATDWGTYASPCDHNTDNQSWARTLWRVGVDAAWFGNRYDLRENAPASSLHYPGKTRIQAKIDNIQTYFNNFYKKNPQEPNANRFSTICRSLVPSGSAAGCNPGSDHNSYFVNTALSAYANVFDADGTTTAAIRREALEEAISTTLANDQYDQETIGVYTMLFLSGNFPNPMSVE